MGCTAGRLQRVDETNWVTVGDEKSAVSRKRQGASWAEGHTRHTHQSDSEKYGDRRRLRKGSITLTIDRENDLHAQLEQLLEENKQKQNEIEALRGHINRVPVDRGHSELPELSLDLSPVPIPSGGVDDPPERAPLPITVPATPATGQEASSTSHPVPSHSAPSRVVGAERAEVERKVLEYLRSPSGKQHSFAVLEVEAITNPKELQSFEIRCSQLVDPAAVKRKCYGPVTDSGRIEEKCELAIKSGGYGMGLYFQDFTTLLAVEAVFEVLVCEVAVGRAWKYDRRARNLDLTRVQSAGFDSVHTPAVGTEAPQYVVYHKDQAIQKFRVRVMAVLDQCDPSSLLPDDRGDHSVALGFKDVEEEACCPICTDLFLEATTLECSHTFCADCLGKWLEQQLCCPVCRRAVRGSGVRNRMVDNIVHKLINKMDESKKQPLQKDRQARQAAAQACTRARAPPAAPSAPSVNLDETELWFYEDALQRVLANESRHGVASAESIPLALHFAPPPPPMPDMSIFNLNLNVSTGQQRERGVGPSPMVSYIPTFNMPPLPRATQAVVNSSQYPQQMGSYSSSPFYSASSSRVPFQGSGGPVHLRPVRTSLPNPFAPLQQSYAMNILASQAVPDLTESNIQLASTQRRRRMQQHYGLQWRIPMPDPDPDDPTLV